MVEGDRGRVAAGRDGRAPRSGGLAAVDPGGALRTDLRPYQRTGVRWLLTLASLGLGGCLADDMGLGKTIQVLALLLAPEASRARRGRTSSSSRPRSSRTGRAEIERFAPSLEDARGAPVGHRPRASWRALARPGSREADVVVTTLRLASTGSRGCARPTGRSSCSTRRRPSRTRAPGRRRAVKALKAAARLALTGTPVENRLCGPLVALRFPRPGPARLGRGVQDGSSSALAKRRRAGYGPLRRARAAVHPAAAEDRQARHRRPARQDRGAGLLRADQGAGGALRSRRSRSCATALDEASRASSGAASSWPS